MFKLTPQQIDNDSLKIALIAYRDHPPQDRTFVTREYDFTSDVDTIKGHLRQQYASGGGDGPEAVTAAMHACKRLSWREGSVKIVVLIADAPPHGLSEIGDGFPAGDPDGHDPLQLVRLMSSQGITFFPVACEPTLSGYAFGPDFFKALATISGGLLLPLTNASLLASVIIGSVNEQVDMERLIDQVGAQIAHAVVGRGLSVDDVTKELHEKLQLGGVSTRQLDIDDVYEESAEAESNLKALTEAQTLADARPLLKKVPNRYRGVYDSSIYRMHPRRTATAASTVTPSTSPEASHGFSSDSSPTMGSSPKRKTGGASRTQLSFGAGTSPEIFQNVSMKQAVISMEQTKRLVTQSAWRGMRA